MTPTPLPLRFFRGARLALHIIWAIICVIAVFPLLAPEQRLRLKRRWSRRLLDILAIRLDAPLDGIPPGNLIVANHVSWLDIFALNAVRPAAFIAKAEVRQWPLIGWLAARNDTVFLQRGSRGHAKTVNGQIDALLTAGRDVALFPEGTTTDGTHLLGFHAALLQPAVETGHPVLPVAISYHDESGRISTTPAYAGDTTLKECLLAILSSHSLTVRLQPTAPIATTERTRREVSLAAHRAIADILATRNGFLPAAPAPEKSPGLPA
ncbi:lysophospholipid acyltransferase family protein [Propionivibrio limicola]|uniref:lysophospholipid acyltransferase family protein n=1 Tax=Propionivibrio limicola TaxID=167645 RepID=UPI001290F4AB|nr:lysophospholipid acyltransferase family protein [Propionivibrio limicola]